MTIPDEDLSRQAVASLRGYAYQVWASALAWAELSGAETILFEVAEDYATACREALTLTQVKDTIGSGSATLRSPGVVKAINAFWRFREANRGRRVHLVYMTTSEPGREQGISFPDELPGLRHWRAAARDGVDLSALRGLLDTLDLDAGLKTWLAQADDPTLRDVLLRRIRWECGRPDMAGVEALLDERLILLCHSLGAPPSTAVAVRDRVLLDALRATASADPTLRQRTFAQLLSIVEQATSISMPIRSVRAAVAPSAESALSVLQPLEGGAAGRWTVSRPDAEASLARGLSAGRAWLFGPSGSGKTALARSVTRATNRPWFSVDLRDLPRREITARLVAARRELMSLSDVAGVLLDDFPLDAASSARGELEALVALLDRFDARLLVTSYKAPAPTLISALDLPQSAIVPAPSFVEDETSDLIKAAGGDAAIWSRSVQLFCGGGFPQLVAARVTGLRLRGWPQSELLDGILDGRGPRDVEAEQEATRLRLFDELPDGPRSLLYRLSLMTSAFDRDLAMALGTAPPPITEAGAALDLLSGPWLEILPGDRLRVSPLLSNAGSKVLSPTERVSVHRAICDALTSQNPFPAEDLPQLLTSSMTADHHRGYNVVAAAAMSPKADAEALSAYLYLLPMLTVTEPLVPSNSRVNRLLRIAQLKVAAAGDDADRIDAIYRRLLVELSGTEREDLQRGMAAYIALSAEKAKIPPARWFDYLAEVEDDDLRAQLEGARSLRDEPDDDEDDDSDIRKAENTTDESTLDPDPKFEAAMRDMALALFILRAATVEGMETLEGLFAALDALPEARRHRYLDGLPESHGGRRSIVEGAWLKDANKPAFDGAAAAARYATLRAIADRWNDSGLALECLCCQAVLLAEYADDNDGALALLDTAEADWPGNPRLIRERNKIHFRQGRFDEVLATSTNLLDAIPESQAVERTHVAREFAISASQTGDLKSAIEFLGMAQTTAAEGGILPEMTVGLAGDRAFLIWREGDRARAVEAVRDAVLASEGLDPGSERGTYVVRALSMVVRAMYQDLTAPGWDQDFPSVFGIASRPPQAWSDGPKPTLLSLWYQLEAVESELGMAFGVGALLAERTIDQKIVTMEFIKWSRAFLPIVAQDDARSFVEGISEFARSGEWSRNQSQNDELDPNLFDAVPALPWDGLYDNDNRDQRNFAEGAVLTSIGFAAARGDDDWISRLKSTVPGDPGISVVLARLPDSISLLDPNSPDDYLRVIWALRILRQDRPPPMELLFATVRVWEWLENTLSSADLAKALGPLVAGKWRYIATEARFALRAPATNGPEILAAAETVVDRAGIGRLVLASAYATQLNIPAATLADIRVKSFRP